MDKTNRSTRNTPTNTANAQQQSRPTAATVPQPAGTTVPSGSASLAQQASSLTSASGGNARAVQDAIVKKLDVSCKILTSLLEQLPSDASAMARILRLLTQTSPNNPMSLMEQFTQSHHEAGTAFLRQFLGTLRPFLEYALSQNLADPSIRKTVLDVLSLKTAGMPFMISFYKTSQKKDIDFIESVLIELLSSQDAEVSSGIFQLAQVFNKKTISYIQDYVFGYCKALEYDAWSETSPEQFAFYFLYGFLGNSLDVLGCLFSCLEACPHIEFKVQAEQKISEFFGFFLKDLRKAYIKNYVIRAEDYDETILYVCKALPQFVDEKIVDLLMHAANHPSIEFLERLIAIENPKKQCFLDIIYAAAQSPEGRVNGLVLSLISTIENCLIQNDEHCVLVSPVLLNLALPNLIQYLSKVSMETIAGYNRNAERKQCQYLILSILIKDINCIQRFKDAPITSSEQAQCLSISLIQLMKHLFGIDAYVGVHASPLSAIKELHPRSRELFFEILEVLKALNVLEQLDLTTNLLSICLNQDFIADMAGTSTPNFDYMLQGLQKIGFDLHYIDPETGHNILSEAYKLEKDLGNLKLFTKLFRLGCNPFLIRKNGKSIYHQLASHAFYGRRDLQDIFSLDEEAFLPLSFTKNILKGNRLDKCDAKGRTPLMRYVMTNLDIKAMFGSNLQKLESKHLEAKDNRGWTVFDYANHNRDQRTLTLLNDRKKALEQKANKPNIFRQAAGLAVKLATPKAQNVEASTPKTPQAPSSSSKRRQARKLKDKEGGSPANLVSAQEITIDYNPETETSETSMKEVREKAAAKIAKGNSKKKKKEDKEKTAPAPENQEGAQAPKKKEGLLAKAKKKIKAVATTLETAKNLAANPQSFVQALASKLNQPKTGERLASGQRVYNIGKAKAFAMLEDDHQLGLFIALSDLADKLNKIKEGSVEKKHIKVLEELEEKLRSNASKIKSNPGFIQRLQDTISAIMGMGRDQVRGSHKNLAWAKGSNQEGGGISIVVHGNEMDIQNLRGIFDVLQYKLKSLIREMETKPSLLSLTSSSESSKTSSEESGEEQKNETPEPSESSE